MSYSDLNDEQLVEVVRKTDQEAYGEVVRRYQGKIAHYLRKFIHHSAELEDVVQDVFIKAFRNLYAFDINMKFSSWIFRVAHNEAINNIQKRKRECLFLDMTELNLVDEKIDLVQMTDANFTKERVARALTQLKDKYRSPLILFFFEGKTYEEIGDILKIPKNTVGILIFRGKKILQKFIQ